MEVVIKTATLADLQDVQELNLKLFEKEYKEYDSLLDLNWTFGKAGTKYHRDKISKDDGCILIAVSGNKTIGYLSGGLARVGSFGRSPDISVAEIENFFILDKFRSKGIGKQLHNKFAEWCKIKNVDKIRLDVPFQNKSAIKFYKNNNFKDYYITLETDL